jgi:hypothetical protein
VHSPEFKPNIIKNTFSQELMITLKLTVKEPAIEPKEG